MVAIVTDMTQLYEQLAFPIFQNRMYDSAEEARACTRGDVRLVQDDITGLVYNAAFQPELMNYDTAYQNEQAHSPLVKSLLEQVATIVERSLGTDELVEIGCGKGYFLELLQSHGCSITGFDPAYEGENPAIQRRYFGDDVTVSARGIIMRGVLNQLQNPIGFLDDLRDANGGGLIYIEAQCFDATMRARAWFDIHYEYVNYFRLGDFSRMFGRVLESGHLFGGQYLYVVADLATLRPPVSSPADRVAFPEDFLAMPTVTPPVDRVGGLSAVWGASSKGVIYSLMRERCGNPVDVLIDINPAKCGKFVPATGLRVMSPEEGMAALPPGSDIYVMNSIYMEEIREMTADRFNLIEVLR